MQNMQATADSIQHETGIFLRMVQKWNDAAAVWNPDELTRLYADDALFFGGRQEHFVGRDQVKIYFESYRDMLASVELRPKQQHIRRLPSGLVMAQGFADIGFTLLSGSRTNAMFRTSWLLQPCDSSTWEITTHHFSPVPETVPIPT